MASCYVMRLRCISKKFNALVLDSNFTHVHHLLFMIHDDGTRFLMGKAKDLYAVDLNEDGNTSRWNFDRRDQYFNGPCVNGYEPVEKKYKVLMQVQNSSGHAWNFIYALSIDKSWRKIKDIINFFPCFSMKTCSIKGFIYMIDYSKNSIVAFDLRAEKFRVIGLGDDIYKNLFYYNLIGVKEKIALLDCWGSFTGRYDLWILENLEKEEWKSHILKPKYGPPQGFCDSRDGEIIFIAMKNNILFCYFYDVGKISWRYLEIHGTPIEDEINGINIYVESLYLC
ncbi:hypothetical protein H5410_015270 [Solanum commersonii]|uniref:F-box associated beta-propeller type 3 domain-containing protein n=1 Tax=Solanum commersonii TaxID=4109 RepID=A0A9J5ZT82_SOLCO|nr:hypothetical protein H5410_015270 [Solanum commersonii]